MADKFATAINCMDGRVQDPVNNWLKSKTDAKYVDVITEAGPDKLMASTSTASRLILQRILVSRDKHGSEDLALVAHHDCAGNPVTRMEHLAHLKRAATIMETWDLKMNIYMLWVNDEWQVELVEEIKS